MNEEMFCYGKQYKKAVTFSYDDGVVFDERLITIFNKYGLKATFNMNGINENQETGWVTQRGLLVKRYDLQRENNVRIYDGHEIAVHTRHHYWLNQIDENTLEEEIVGNREDLERVFGREVNGMAYPFNTYDDRSVDILRKNGFLYAREGRETHSFALQEDLLRFRPTCHHNDPTLFSLAEEFINSEYDELKIFYIWGHSYEFEDDHNWERMEEFCRFISRKDDIFYGTNSEVFRLQKEQVKRKDEKE